MINLDNNLTSKISQYSTKAGIGLATIILFIAIISGNNKSETPIVFTNAPFKFQVYCPISSKQYLQQYANLILNPQIASLQNLNLSDTYVVYMKAKRSDEANPQSQAQLHYCGLARSWEGTCDNAQFICSSPGPMFYLPVGQSVNIIWINGISSEGLNWVEEDCYAPDSDNAHCSTDARLNQNYAAKSCSFLEPTNLGSPTKKVRVNKNQVPLSPHIHGLMTRPAYDGNPLGWFNNNGDFGVGYFSLDNPDYFNEFLQPDKYEKLPDQLNATWKIIKAYNDQPPGNLFYHDHGMRSTRYNVKHGLSGLYILYNSSLERQLPKGNYQKFIVFSQAVDGDARKGFNTNPSASQAIITSLNASQVFERNMTYRIRILNGHFDNVYNNLYFAAYYYTFLQPNGQKIYQEINPSSSKYNLSQNIHIINFTVIGTDSTLFHKTVHNVQSLDLGSAERAEILISFDELNGLPKNIQNIYLICLDKNANEIVIKYKFSLSTKYSSNKYKRPNQIDNIYDIYTNLSTVNPNDIVVKRFRSLFNRPRDQMFLINGHYMFDMGASDFPKIGTIEDWYIINNLWQGHPIHFHLVNFQVIQTYRLKTVIADGEQCSLYQLDFFKNTGSPIFNFLNYVELCSFLAKNLTTDDYKSLYQSFSSYNLENITINTADYGTISGLNVIQLIKTPTDQSDYILPNSNCPLNTQYKYLCEDTTSQLPEYRRRWKDTELVKEYSVSVLRIRWTKTEYDPEIQPYPYFSVPEDQLMEFPGFVYHCHILPHEDNEMMRPFMLQPSDLYLSMADYMNNNVGTNRFPLSWPEKMRDLNNKYNCR